MTLTEGTRFGRYEIVAALGAGGMGEVYRAHDAELGREVAIKMLRGDVASTPERLARFGREARLLASLNHPNVATGGDTVAFVSSERLWSAALPGGSVNGPDAGQCEADGTPPGIELGAFRPPALWIESFREIRSRLWARGLGRWVGAPSPLGEGQG